MPSLQLRPFQAADAPAVIALWQRCGLTHPKNNPAKDILRKSTVRPDLFIVGLIDETIVASVMVGYEGHRGWINYLAVDPAHQRRGHGETLMREAERLLRAEGCPKINLQVRSTNRGVLTFYKKIGFSPDDVVSLGKRLERDDADPRP